MLPRISWVMMGKKEALLYRLYFRKLTSPLSHTMLSNFFHVTCVVFHAKSRWIQVGLIPHATICWRLNIKEIRNSISNLQGGIKVFAQFVTAKATIQMIWFLYKSTNLFGWLKSFSHLFGMLKKSCCVKLWRTQPFEMWDYDATKKNFSHCFYSRTFLMNS